MARRGRDLYEILGAHAGGQGARQTTGKTKGASVAADLGVGFLDWFRALFDGRRPRRARASARRSRGLAVSGLGLSVAVLASLAAGFGLGRFTGGEAATAGLSAPAGARGGEEGARRGQAPGWLVASDFALSPEREVERLSNLGFLLLPYPASDRQAASQLAAWLRSQELPNARLRLMQDAKDKSNWWVVVCYTSEADNARDFERLRGLPTPDFCPDFRETVLELETAVRENRAPMKFKDTQ